MQEGTGRVRRHDGRESPKAESALENICGARASRCVRGGAMLQNPRANKHAAAAAHKANKALCVKSLTGVQEAGHGQIP